jgi:hypothetical protein
MKLSMSTMPLERARFNGVIRESLPLVIPTLQPLKFLRRNINIVLTPVANYYKNLYVYHAV